MGKKTNLKGRVVVAVILLGLAPTIAAGGVIYVDNDADPCGNGTSWGSAYKYLQDGLADASSASKPVEIWVAAGTYKPDADEGANVDPNDRTETFQLINHMAIYGGFAGGESTLDERDVEFYETMLSGDIGVADVNTDNSYHVVTGSGTDANAVLDGFTITAGNAGTQLSGGGMYNDSGSPTVTNCIFSDNSAGDYGGGMSNDDNSSPTVTNCIFSDNSAGGYGGGMSNDDNSSPTVTNCIFSDNSGGGYGGGMRNYQSSPTVTNCSFSGNSAGNGGGGMDNQNYSSPILTNCTFTGNSGGSHWGGGMWNNTYSNPTVTNCTFSGNSVARYGGGMANSENSPTLTNCTFSGNSANYGGGMWNYYYSTPTLTNCILWGDTADTAGAEIALYSSVYPSTLTISYSDVEGGEAGVYVDSGCTLNWDAGSNINVDPMFKDANGNDEIPGTDDDNLRLSADSNCIDAGDNTAVPGGVTTDLDGNPRFFDDPFTTDTGNGTPPIVDMGAYEYQVRTLTISSTSGGTVTEPGEGPFPYESGTVVQIIAQADMDYIFVEWTGTAVDAGKVAEPLAADTTVTVDGDYSLVANFAIERMLTISSTSGGTVTEPGEGPYQYAHGTVVQIIAQAYMNYHFVEWAGTAVDAGKVANASAAGTTVTVDADYTLVANFAMTIIYVDVSAPGPTHDGSSWTEGYLYLQDALGAAGSGSEIWVAEGMYYPDEDEGANVDPNDRTETFQLINGVAIYGGFAGFGAADPNERNVELYETILSGDIGVADVNTDNSYHVVTGSGTDATAVLNGFTITAGNASGSWPALTALGGGMYNNSASPKVTNCTFRGNLAESGGGMWNSSSSPTVTNCTFSGNSIISNGGGMFNWASSPTISNCTFSGNSANSGGGMLNNVGSSLTLTNCTFTGNLAEGTGGGIFNVDSSVTVTNCTLSGNSAGSEGGGMYNLNGSTTVTNCILWGNSAPSGPEIYNETVTTTISYSDIDGCGGSGVGWDPSCGIDGGNNINDDPLFIDPNGLDGIPGTADDEEGYVHLRGYSPCINAGDPGGDYSGQVDIDNQPRVAYGRVDMGADEVFPIAGDVEPDGDVDFGDFAYFAEHWLLGK